MKRFLLVLSLPATLLALAACDNLTGAGLFGSEANSTGDSATTDADGSGDAGDGSTNDDGSDTDDAFAVSGTISAPATAKARARSEGTDAESGYMVVAASNETQEIYTTFTDENGEFKLELPDSEKGSTFIFTIVNPDGRAAGPVLLDDAGTTGMTMLNPASLGTIELPDNPAEQPIEAGKDGDAGTQADPGVGARLDGNGVPVGVPTFGKGDDAKGDKTDAASQALDADRDGLIDIFDADNDGNGIVDDFENASDKGAIRPDAGFHVNFFTNLKVSGNDSAVYYGGDDAAIDAAVAEQTVVTFEVVPEPGATKKITGVRLSAFPAPDYLADFTVMVPTDGGGQAFQNWKELDYRFTEGADRWQAFAIPHAVMNAGDTFGVVVEFEDGTAVKFTRMINYVFKNIPQLVGYGSADVFSPYTTGDVYFDGTKDFILEFKPPVDETGTPLTGMDYYFEFFFQDSSHMQINDIDVNATWPTLPANFNGNFYVVSRDQLATLSPDGTFTVTLPKELFVNTVVKKDASSVAVSGYQIDIAAQNTGNAALKLNYTKQ
ncbi:MAG: hypothetical protein IT450_03820 [Phycisphaerales bacterium]|nr:hypothetical protein [Phycisphaerales bacterium]